MDLIKRIWLVESPPPRPAHRQSSMSYYLEPVRERLSYLIDIISHSLGDKREYGVTYGVLRKDFMEYSVVVRSTIRIHYSDSEGLSGFMKLNSQLGHSQVFIATVHLGYKVSFPQSQIAICRFTESICRINCMG